MRVQMGFVISLTLGFLVACSSVSRAPANFEAASGPRYHLVRLVEESPSASFLVETQGDGFRILGEGALDYGAFAAHSKLKVSEHPKPNQYIRIAKPAGPGEFTHSFYRLLSDYERRAESQIFNSADEAQAAIPEYEEKIYLIVSDPSE